MSIPGVPDDGQWHHMQVDHRDGVSSWYVDGKKVDEMDSVWPRALWKRGGEDEVDIEVKWTPEEYEPGTHVWDPVKGVWIKIAGPPSEDDRPTSE